MNIVVNGENHPLDEPITLKQLISLLNLEDKRLAVEVNQDIIPRSEYADYQLRDNDRVEIVQAIGGG